MANFLTTGLTIPTQMLEPWLGKVKYGSTVATLSAQTPMLFGPGASMTFDIGEAEYVAEGANKAGTTITPTTVTVTPFKFHKTVRWSEEVKWADQDHQLNAISQVLDLLQPALSRALDFGVFHGINPTGGAVVAAMTQKLLSHNQQCGDRRRRQAVRQPGRRGCAGPGGQLQPTRCGAGADVRCIIRRSAQRHIGAETVSGFLVCNCPAGRIDNHNSSVSNTVSAIGIAAVATTVKAFVGDFSAIRWGVQRAIGLEMIEYGDPDGGGDLKRNNQVAFRAEVVYGWGIADLNAFCKIIDAV